MADGDISIVTLPLARLDEFVAAQNEIFADYIVPMKVTKQFFLDFLRSVGGRLSRVLIALDEGRIVGYVNPVVGGREAWIGGLGVVPDHRGMGIGRALMARAEEECRREGVEEVSLEVIIGNDQAHRLYERMGYVDTRRYVSAEGRPARYEGRRLRPEKASLSDLLGLHGRCYADSCWQKRKSTSLAESARTCECFKAEGGFVLVRGMGTIGLIPFLGVAPEARGQGVGTDLAKFALTRLFELGAYKVSLYNLNDDLATMRMLDKFDFMVTMEQTEMRKRL